MSPWTKWELCKLVMLCYLCACVTVILARLS